MAFCAVNLRVEGALATDDAAAAAATRILQLKVAFTLIFIIFTHRKKLELLEIKLQYTFYAHQRIHLFHLQSPPA